MARAASGPMPGSTPISVPIMAPRKQKARLVGLNATWKPRVSSLNSSTASAADRFRPVRHGQAEPVDEQGGSRRDGNGGQDRLLARAELDGARRRAQHGEQAGNDEPELVDQPGEDKERAADQ